MIIPLQDAYHNEIKPLIEGYSTADYGPLMHNGEVITQDLMMYVHYFTEIPLSHIFIAFAPGGLETMIAMGGLVSAEPTYIASHHVSRLFFLAFLIPILLKKDIKVN